jgi:raffinose/stachyose/melibiose transport system permease protein
MSVITSSRDGQQVPLKKPPRASAEHVDKTYPLWFHIPGGLVYLVLFIVPTVFSFYFAFTRWTLFKATFIGFENFVLFFNEPGLIGSLKNTLIYGVLTSTAKVVLGMLLAVVLSAPIIARGYLRSVTFFPVLISAVGVGLTFQVLLDPFNGIVNKAITAITGADGPGWLTDPNIALLSVVGIDVWKGIGLATLIYIAGIAAIPNEYFEAARVDGANSWQMFRNIILPLSFPATSTVIILSLIGGLRSFDLIWTTTQGGPGFASDVIASVVYKQYQAGFYGLSTAGNVILFIVVTAIVYPLSRWLNSKETVL